MPPDVQLESGGFRAGRKGADPGTGYHQNAQRQEKGNAKHDGPPRVCRGLLVNTRVSPAGFPAQGGNWGPSRFGPDKLPGMAESQQRPGVLGIPALVSLAVAAAAFASYAATAAVLLSAGARRTNVSTRTV